MELQVLSSGLFISSVPKHCHLGTPMQKLTAKSSTSFVFFILSN